MIGILIFGGIFIAMVAAGARSSTPPPMIGAVASAGSLRETLRKLWEDYSIYVHLLVVSTYAGLQDKAFIRNRLIDNSNEIADAIRPFLGEATTSQLRTLLNQQVQITIDVVEAVKLGLQNPIEMKRQLQRWYANARDVATLLSSASPQLSLSDIDQVLRSHLDAIVAEVNARTRDRTDIAGFDRDRTNMIALADVIADGLARQSRSGSRGTYRS